MLARSPRALAALAALASAALLAAVAPNALAGSATTRPAGPSARSLAAPSGLRAAYTKVRDWGSGYEGSFTVTNGTSATIPSWTLVFQLTPGAKLAGYWNAVATTSGAQVSMTGTSWNSSLTPGASTQIGFDVAYSGHYADPSGCTINAATCDGSGTSQTPPDAPSALTVTATSATSVGLSWTAPLGLVSGYQVYDGTRAAAKVTGTTATVAGLKPQSTHAFSVSADNAAGESPRSESVTVTTPTGGGKAAAWHPDYLSIGTVYTPGSDSVDAYFSQLQQHGPLPSYGYKYLLGNEFGNWAKVTTAQVTSAQHFGMTPVLVEYGMNGNTDGTSVDWTNMQNADWVSQFFTALMNAAKAAGQAAGSSPVGWVVEPDMLGYIQQNYGAQYHDDATTMPAATSAAYSAGVLGDGDPRYPDTLAGLVQAITHAIKKYDTGAFVGWHLNDWAAGDPLKDTDTMGVEAGHKAIVDTAGKVAAFAKSASIGGGADFVAFDQWGQDFGELHDSDPAHDVRYLNGTHWDNYLLYVHTIDAALGLPAVLWQLPCGHLNSTTTPSPTYWNSSGKFPDLDDTTNNAYEDASASFFYGDTFTSSGNALAFFGANPAADPKISVSGNTITWGSHMPDAAAAGVVAILFGAGTPSSTYGVPEAGGGFESAPSDFDFWVTKTQQYLTSPVPLPSPPRPRGTG
jgi:hypothetical protein